MTQWRDGVPAEWVTETEPEYDVNERDNWYALAEYEEALCPQCHQLRSVCSDPSIPYHPQLWVCWSSAAKTVATRRWHKLHEKTKPDEAGYMPTDGGQVWVSTEDLTPDDNFLDDLPTTGVLGD